MWKIVHFFKTKGRWRILLLVFVVLLFFFVQEYFSDAYRFSLKVIKLSDLFEEEPSIVFIMRMKHAYFSDYEEEALARLYVVGKNNGWLVLSIKKEEGNWCVASASFNGDIINVLPCEKTYRKY